MYVFGERKCDVVVDSVRILDKWLVVLLKSEVKDKVLWKFGWVVDKYIGKGGVICWLKLR